MCKRWGRWLMMTCGWLMAGATVAAVAATSSVAVSTTTLPGGTVGAAYSATLSASGGKSPYVWALASGSLPPPLTLSSAGVISGTPKTAGSYKFGVKVTDSQKHTATATLSIAIASASPPASTVTLSPRAASATLGQSLTLTVTTTDPAGVKLTTTGGGLSVSSVPTGTSSVSWTAPATVGSYTVTATTVTTPTKAVTSTLGVTNLAAVATYHNDLYRSGANTQEYVLTPSNVTSTTFGKRFSCPVDGAIYGQPLWAGGVVVGGVSHNVVYVTTQHESVYAFDADASSCVQLWTASLVDSAHGGQSGEHSVPSCGSGTLVGAGYCDIAPEVGITGTPVIDATAGKLYVVAKSVDATPTFYQRLHALNLATGADTVAPALIGGTATSEQHGTITFSPGQQHQRAGLALANGYVYVTWSSHEDKTPYYGWVMAFDAGTLAPSGVFNSAPDVGMGGIWMGGDAPAVDASGNVYLVTGNATYDASSNTTQPNDDYGDSVLRLSSANATLATTPLGLTSYFTPSDQASDNTSDADLGSGGLALIDLPTNLTTTAQQLAVGGGKDGYLNVLNRANLGGFSSVDAHVIQRFSIGYGIFSTAAIWNGWLYIGGSGGPLQAFPYTATATPVATARSSASSATFGFPGTTPSVSSTPTFTNGIVWALDNSKYCTNQSSGCGPAVLHAYDATNLSKELWNSSQGTGNAAGYAVKFTVPTVANGRVFVGTRGANNGTSGTPAGELDVYGLLP